MTIASRRLSAVALALTLALAPRAQAEAPAASDPAARAAVLKQQGDEAMGSLQYADALKAYAEAYVLSQSPALLYNQGRALQALGRFPEALEQLEAFKAKAPPELLARVPALDALIAEVRARVATLMVESNVAGARVLVRNTVVGKTPLPAPLSLNAGKAELSVEAEGYFPYRKDLELPGGGAVTVHAELPSRATTGVLAVRTNASGAEVSVDGKRVGVAPLETIVGAGEHKILAKHPDFADTETSVTIAAGQRRDVAVDLKPPSIASRWWFWTAIGAVVLGGVAVTAVALSEREADTGDIEPGQVTAPLRPAGTLLRF